MTELCEAGVPESVIRELAGHIDPSMTRWYAHPRMAARRAAVEKLSIVGLAVKDDGYVTKHVTTGEANGNKNNPTDTKPWCARRDSNSRPIAPELFSADLAWVGHSCNWLETLKRAGTQGNPLQLHLNRHPLHFPLHSESGQQPSSSQLAPRIFPPSLSFTLGVWPT